MWVIIQLAVRWDEVEIAKVWGPYRSIGDAFAASADLDKALPEPEDSECHWEFDVREVTKCGT